MYYQGDPQQQMELQMQMQMMANPAAGMMMGMSPGINNNPNYFNFIGNSLSLQSRLNGMTDQQANQIIDATIIVNGRQVKPQNTCGLLCTVIWGSIIILPLFFMCCDWWKKCVYPAFDIDFSVYASLAKLFRSRNLRNVSLTVIDNTFDNNKSSILYQMISESRVNGFTFINQAGNWDFLKSEHSDFNKNMKPIKMLTKIMSDIRWGTQIVL